MNLLKTGTLNRTFGVIAVLVTGLIASSNALSDDHVIVKLDAAGFNQVVRPFIEMHCLGCHGKDAPAADLSLVKDKFTLDNPQQASQWLSVLGQLQARLMPPMSETRPDHQQRAKVIYWIEQNLLASKYGESYKRKTLLPAYGNLVNHDLLFSGKIKSKPYTTARVWRRSPFIFEGSVRNVGKAKIQNPYTYSTPKNGVRDYAQTSFVGASVVETIVQNANAEIDYAFDQLTGGAERDRVADQQRKKAAEAFNEKILKEAQGILDAKQGKGNNARLKKKQSRKSSKSNQPTNSKRKPRRSHPFEPYLKGTDGLELTKEQLAEPLISTFERFASRKPTKSELAKYVGLLKKNLLETKDPRESLKGALIAIYLSPEAIYRQEWGLGSVDEYGRRMLSPNEIAFALSFALFDSGPHSGVKKGEASAGLIGKALEQNRLNTQEDVAKLVAEILNHEVFPPGRANPAPRLLRFFHEFFGYDRCGDVFKDAHEANLHNVYVDPRQMTAEADALLKVILRDDENVFERMLSTNELVVKHTGAPADGPEMERQKQNRRDQIKRLEKFIADFDLVKEKQNVIKGRMKKPLYRNNPKLMAEVIAGAEKTALSKLAGTKRELKKLRETPVTVVKRPDSKRAHAVTMYNITLKDWRPNQPLSMPEYQRAGILTHPAWLVAHSFNAENDPVRRGIWIYEKLLAGYLADVPPDVDAQIPEDHTKSLKERMEILRDDQCWKCHHRINPLGEAFEVYNHYGRWVDADYFDNDRKLFTSLRTFHQVEQNGRMRSVFRIIDHKDLVSKGELTRRPINVRGSLDTIGIPGVSGDFKDATELCRILAKTPRVRQSIIRHAFRYFMGRNETLDDSQTLIDADQAYLNSGGSFKAVVVALLSSDSFLFRK